MHDTKIWKGLNLWKGTNIIYYSYLYNYSIHPPLWHMKIPDLLWRTVCLYYVLKIIIGVGSGPTHKHACELYRRCSLTCLFSSPYQTCDLCPSSQHKANYGVEAVQLMCMHTSGGCVLCKGMVMIIMSNIITPYV